ncbi:MAG TPA: DUF1223 domain-containing protein [Kofleriaceae bacterium]|nr:DUF1223 domain-containing protein [Kofleriaceae bacterium]
MNTRAWLALAVIAGCSSASGDPPAAPASRAAGPTRVPAADQGPVVVELFTSQGCSSCPPADRVLSALVRDGRVGDRAVVPLAFHVDYWNDLGWADPFSQGAWSDRQRDYAAVHRSAQLYTPQLMVGGATDVLGSNARAVKAAIAAAPAPARLDATIAWRAGAATVTATAPAGADAWVALYEDDVATRVVRGENAGATLRNDHIVRRLERIAAAGQAGTVEVALEPAWKHVGAVAFAQAADRTIVASRALGARP